MKRSNHVLVSVAMTTLLGASLAAAQVPTGADAQAPAPAPGGPINSLQPPATPAAATPAAATPAAPSQAASAQAGTTKAIPAQAPSAPSAPATPPVDAGHDGGTTVHLGPWDVRPFGYLRAGYEHVQKDDRYEFVGRNSGFVLDSARLGVDVARGEDLSLRLSIDGAGGEAEAYNTPMGSLSVNLRDAYLRYDPIRQLGIQVGQFFAPFAGEEMRSREDLLFATRAVGQEGVLAGRGLQQPGLAVDRQIGVMLSQRRPLQLGPVGLQTYAMLANGNGANQLLNDDNSPAFYARVELYLKEYARLGGAFLRNGRRVGTPPDLLDEKDTGFAGDLLVNVGGLEVFGQFAQVSTEHQTAGGSDRKQRSLSAQAGYRIKLSSVWITPGYRFARYQPWLAGDEAKDAAALDTFDLTYHTVGVRFEHARLPLKLWVDYTLTQEKDPHVLDNDRLQIMTQAGF